MSGIFILWLSLALHLKGSELHKPEGETMQNGKMCLSSPILRSKFIALILLCFGSLFYNYFLSK